MKFSHLTSFGGGALLCGMGVFVWHLLRVPETHVAHNKPNQQAVVAAAPARTLSTGVAALLSPEHVSLAHRKDYLSPLGYQLSQADRIALLDSISNSPPNGLSMEEWYALANGILDLLREQRPAMPEFTDRMIALWLDRNLQPTLRDYVFQELREWVMDKDTRTMQEERPEKLALIRQTFLDACTAGHPYCDPQSTTTGTALLALNEWTGASTPEAARINAAELDPVLLSFTKDPHAHRGIRATALQLCARRRITEALPLARKEASNGSADIILRLAAISYLSELGSLEDRAMLTELSQITGADPLVRGALATALRAGATAESLPNP